MGKSAPPSPPIILPPEGGGQGMMPPNVQMPGFMPMPAMPSVPEMPTPTQIPEVNWKERREKLNAEARAEWAKKFKRQQGRLSTVLTGSDDRDDTIPTQSTVLTGTRKESRPMNPRIKARKS